jgi:Mrp family chromosome partitioning ATPase
MGITGGLVFLAALIAFVFVPRQATRAAVRVSATLEERPDSNRTVATRNRAAQQIASADSMLALARRTIVSVPVQAVDTFPPEAIAQRAALSDEVATLNRLIDRADNAPLPASYRALAMIPSVAADPAVQGLLDSLADIERERDAFGAVGGVDPVYVALTSRATAVGRSIQAIAETKRAEVRSRLALLRPAAPAPAPSRQKVDTTRFAAQKASAQQSYKTAVQTLAEMRAVNDRIDRAAAKARDLANLGAPPLAMLAAAIVLALSLGFAASLFIELRNPTVADSREAEQVTGVRVLTVVASKEVMPERSRRLADISAPPLIDVVSESYRRLYLHLAATEANVPIVTVAGDDASIVATVAANIAAAAAYEARSTLLVDVDPVTSTIASIFRVRSNPGLAGIIAGTSDWPESVRQTTIGRDRVLDLLPSGTRRSGSLTGAAERIRADFARMERRYDLIVIAAPAAYVARGRQSIIPGPDVVLCARVAHTKIARIREMVDSLRALDLRIQGLVLWDDDMPVLEAHEEPPEPVRPGSGALNLAGVR